MGELKPILKSKQYEHFVILDIETDYRNGSLLEIGISNGTSHQFYTAWLPCIDALFERCQKIKGKRLSIIAHNGGKFDYIALLMDSDILENYQITTSFANSSIVSAKITKKGEKGQLTLKDSFLLLPSSLKKLAKAFNSPDNQKLDVDYKLLPDLFKNNKKLFREYLTHDLTSLYHIIKTFQEQLQIEHIPFTTASLALYKFRCDHLNESLTNYRGKVDEYITQAYAGGRVECFRPGKYTHVNVYDINSQYPFQMVNEAIGIGKPLYTRSYMEGKTGCYHVKFNQTDKSIPPLLWTKQDGDLLKIYSGEGYFMTPELIEAKKIGIELQFIDGYYFEKSQIIFEDYVLKYYALKQSNEKDAPMYFIAKILLNSLYGKFAQRPEQSTLFLGDNSFNEAEKQKKKEDNRSKTESEIKLYNVENDIWELKSESQHDHRIVHISAHVTSAARVHLYQVLKAHPANIVYCDTDSVHLNNNIKLNPYLVDDSELGKWDLENKNEIGIYIANKWYKIGEKCKGKGFKANSLTDAQWDAALNNESIKTTYESMPTFKRVINSNLQECLMYEVSKQLRPTNKSIFLENYHG